MNAYFLASLPNLGQKYQWGSSFIQFFIMAVLLLIWPTCIMWRKARGCLDLKDEAEVTRG